MVESQTACHYELGSVDIAATHVEFEHVRRCYDRFGVMAVFEKCISDSFGAIYEEAAKEAVLFLGNPVASAVLADENKR